MCIYWYMNIKCAPVTGTEKTSWPPRREGLKEMFPRATNPGQNHSRFSHIPQPRCKEIQTPDVSQRWATSSPSPGLFWPPQKPCPRRWKPSAEPPVGRKTNPAHFEST